MNLVYSQRNRSACIRIPMYSDSPKAKRIEFRCPDAAANPYLAFSAMLMAGVDGIERGLDPGAPADYDLFEEAGHDVSQVPGSLAEALDALEADHEFLLRGVRYRAVGASVLLRDNLLIYGLGGIVAPFIGIKAIDMVLAALRLV